MEPTEGINVSDERASGVLPTTDGLALTGQLPEGRPRVVPMSQAAPQRPEPEVSAGLPKTGHAVTGRPATEVPVSEYRRVRTLAKYGMTVEEVAGLYEITSSEVRRIIRM
jgi:hypothetical protein